MQMVLIQFKSYASDTPRDICIVKDQPRADRHVKDLIDKYTSYTTGEFIFKRIKFVK